MSVRFAPLVVIGLLHTVGLAIFLLGVGVAYPPGNRTVLVAYILLVELAMVLGFAAGTRLALHSLNRLPLAQVARRQQTERFLLAGFLATLLIFGPEVTAYTGGQLSQFLDYLTDPRTAYQLMGEQIAGGREDRLVLILVKMVLSPLLVAVIPGLGFLYFRYRRYGRYLAAASILEFVMSVFRGTDKEIFDVAILLLFAWLAALAHRAAGEGVRRIRLLTWQRAVTGVAAVTAIFGAFSFRKVERTAALDLACFQNTDVCQNLQAAGQWETGLKYFSRYLTQGFYGLSVALDADVSVSGTGLGHSRPLAYLGEQYLGVMSSGGGVTEQLTSLGWTNRGAWSTGYVWIANDVTLYGVPIVILFMALIFGMAWQRVVKSPTLPAVIVAGYSFYTFFYIIGNLQVAQVGFLYVGVLLWASYFLFHNYPQARRSPWSRNHMRTGPGF